MTNILYDAFMHYDMTMHKYKKKFKKFSYYTEEIEDNDIKYNKAFFYDDKDKLIAEGNVHNIGSYIKSSQIWIWAWAYVGAQLVKNKVYLIRKILLYALDWSQDKYKNDFDTILKSFLINSRLKIFNDIQIEIILALTLYITQGMYVFSITYDDEPEIMYKILTDIKSYD